MTLSRKDEGIAMGVDHEKLRLQAEAKADKAVRWYHRCIPDNKRPFFWAVVFIGCAFVLSVIF